MKYFGVMLDMSRNGVMKGEQVKEFAKTIKSFGYNMIQLYTEDTYEVENEPYFGYFRGRYSVEELTDIVNYCNGIGMEVIPCIQTLAHLNNIFRWKEYKQINDIGDILLVDNERTYQLIENMFKTVRKIFTSNYINIGMDEAHLMGLGKYLDSNGYKERYDLFINHLDKVCEIAKKYNFKPVMWSDMFFRLANKGEYYPDNPEISKEIIKATPKDVDLAYWDYYHYDKNIYDKMFSAHLKFENDIWFAGGAWTWTGFASGNRKTLETMYPAMVSAKEHGIENILITEWGDNGNECSYFSVLPSLFAVRKFYDGITDMEQIKSQFNSITNENFDDMMNMDLPNYVGGNRFCSSNPAKHMFYSDPFFGVLDTTVKENVCKEYVEHKNTLINCSKNSKKYSYIYNVLSSLCDVMSIKYNIGLRARQNYQSNNIDELKKVSADFSILIDKLNDFHNKVNIMWHKEKKPFGFEVQDIRIGGLIQRIKTCKQRLDSYINKEIDCLPELDERLLDWFGNGDNWDTKETPEHGPWFMFASVNSLL